MQDVLSVADLPGGADLAPLHEDLQWAATLSAAATATGGLRSMGVSE